MRKLLILFALLHACCIHAFEIDTAARKQIIREGQNELCALIDYNAQVQSPEHMKFVVLIDQNDPMDPHYSRVREKRIDSTVTTVLSQECIDSINARLARTYRDYHVEMYVIVIKSLQIVVQTPLPENFSVNNLFNDPLYDGQTNLQQLRTTHAQITEEIATTTLGPRNRDCLIYSRASYTGSLVKGKVGTWDFTKRTYHFASPRTYIKLDELGSYFADRIINNPDVRQAGLEYSLKAVAREFNESAKYMLMKGAILTTYTSTGMSAIFAQFGGQVDWENLTVTERTHALAVFAGYPMHHNLITKEEYYACRIVESTPGQQAYNFLLNLEARSPLYNNALYAGDKPDEPLIYTLIDEIDDAVFGAGDNYSWLMRALTSVALSNSSFVNSRLPVTTDEWYKRQIYWDDSYIITTPPVGTHNYVVTLQSNGRVKVQKSVVSRLDARPVGDENPSPYMAIWDNAYAPDEMLPFSLVMITNRSSLGMLQMTGMVPDQPMLAPAIVLKYCSDKEFNQNAITGTAILLSTIAVITGPAAIITAVEAGNVALAVFEGLQFVGAYADLVANANTSQEFKDAVNTFNIIVGVWGVARVGVSTAKYTVNYLADVKAGTIGPVPVATAQTYCSQYDAITNWDNVTETMKEQMRRMDEVLNKQITTVGAKATLITNRTTWLSSLQQQFGPFNINNFHPNGIQPSAVPSSLYNEMLAEYSSALPLQDRTHYLDDLIRSGSEIPVKREVVSGEQLVKIVPSGKPVSATTAFFTTLDELENIETSVLFEQKLGLPLSSHSVEYDAYIITANTNTKVFESPIAPTIENGYSTTGGSSQTLVIDRSKWSQPTFYKHITPPVQ